jgi:hypothetical protein
MNERIQELAEQATTIVEMVGPQGYTSSYANFDREKFAELIVRECIFVMKSTVDESIDFERKLDETSSWIESDIKKHFGVEE